MNKVIFVFLFLLGICHELLANNDVTEAKHFLQHHYTFHTSPQGDALDKYCTTIRSIKTPCSTSVLTDSWKECIKSTKDSIYYISDKEKINAEHIERHVLRAYYVWKTSPWKQQVDFNTFRNYILPYRVSEEIVDFKGDSLLQAIYAPYISGVTICVKLSQSFVILYLIA